MMGGFGRCLPTLTSSEVIQLVKALFPRAEDPHTMKIVADKVPLFDLYELLNTVRGMKRQKSPGPDGIPVEVVRVVTEVAPIPVLNSMNFMTTIEHIPDGWKISTLVFIQIRLDYGAYSSIYQSLCLTKLFEKLILLDVHKR